MHQKLIEKLLCWEPNEAQKSELAELQAIRKVMGILEKYWQDEQAEIDFNAFSLAEAERTLYALYEYVCIDEELDNEEEEDPNQQNPLHLYWLTEEVRCQLHYLPPAINEPDYI